MFKVVGGKRRFGTKPTVKAHARVLRAGHMGVELGDWRPQAEKAVAHYWATLAKQKRQQDAKNADKGERSSVTGGKQMDGFCELVSGVLMQNGLSRAAIYTDSKLEIPGHFRAEKKWDLLVVDRGTLVAAMEFKSQASSFGNNFNNRSEEAVGVAHDLAVARREGLFGKPRIQPWVGWLMLLEDAPKSRATVKLREAHFKVDPEFRGSSYARRYELLLRRLMREKLIDGAAFLLAKRGSTGAFTEPADDLGMQGFLAGLAGHVAAYQATR